MTEAFSDPIETRIKTEALRLGFDVCGLTSVETPWPASGRLAEFIDQGRHGSMDWIARTAARSRSSPESHVAGRPVGDRAGGQLRPGRRSAGGAGAWRDRAGASSVYAAGRRLSRADQEAAEGAAPRSWLLSGRRPHARVKVFVDTAPLLEKPLAQSGWAGLAGQAHQPGFSATSAPGCFWARC